MQGELLVIITGTNFRFQQKAHIQKTLIQSLNDGVGIAAEKVELDFGIFFLYRPNDLHDGKSGAIFAAANIDVSGDVFFIFTESAFGLIHQGNNFLGASPQESTFFRQRNFFLAAYQKLLAKVFF